MLIEVRRPPLIPPHLIHLRPISASPQPPPPPKGVSPPVSRRAPFWCSHPPGARLAADHRRGILLKPLCLALASVSALPRKEGWCPLRARSAGPQAAGGRPCAGSSTPGTSACCCYSPSCSSTIFRPSIIS